VDLDNDGYLDLFIVNGHIDDNIRLVRPSMTYDQPNQLFKNSKDKGFKGVSSQSGSGLDLEMVSRGAALGDYDNDGDIDILVTNSSQSLNLLRNDTNSQNHWLVFEVVGMRGNLDGIGVRIKVVTSEHSQIREVKSGGSYPSHSDMRLHFGLGHSTVVDLVEIRWPSGLIEHFKGINADQFLRVIEGKGLSRIPN